jgi:predicted component of type VI protein secretion system
VITLRLYRQSDPFHQLDARTLERGELVIGRGAGADWALPDPTRTLSRRHCVIGVSGTEIALRDVSANGVLIGETREPAPANAARRIQSTDVLRLGDFMIVLDEAADAAAGSGLANDSEADAPFLASRGGPADAPLSDASLLEAFCEGARLSASAFSGEAPDAVMRRLGGVYRQMVVGLADLMSERTTLKARYQMERTAVRAAGNNPFRWADAQCVALDLLRDGGDGFLSGPPAVKASFADVKKHQICVMDGMRAALDATLEALSPQAVEERVAGQSSLLKARSAAAWEEFADLHAQLRRSVKENPDSLASRAFSAAYAARLAALDAAGVPDHPRDASA